MSKEVEEIARRAVNAALSALGAAWLESAFLEGVCAKPEAGALADGGGLMPADGCFIFEEWVGHRRRGQDTLQKSQL